MKRSMTDKGRTCLRPNLTVCEKPTEEIRNAIFAPLATFNAQNGYPGTRSP
jgi:hypothetical protein